ncbi:MAG: hypothetical protein EZS28_042493, partial [Streblomastix strix]
HITVLSNFLTNMVQAEVEGSTNFVSIENVKIFLEFVRFHARLSLGEVLTALRTLEILLFKSKEKNNVVVTGSSLGTALVCVCMIILKYLRDQPYMNSWWAKTFGMDLQTLTESEVVILQLIDWELGMSDNSYLYFASRFNHFFSYESEGQSTYEPGRSNFQEDSTDDQNYDYGSEVPVFGVESSFYLDLGKDEVVDFDQSIELGYQLLTAQEAPICIDGLVCIDYCYDPFVYPDLDPDEEIYYVFQLEEGGIQDNVLVIESFGCVFPSFGGGGVY